METNRRTGTDTDENPKPNTGLTEADTDACAPNPIPTDVHRVTPPHNAQHAMDQIQAARDIISEVRNAAESTPQRVSLDARLTMLEEYMARFAENQRRIAETMRRLELGMSRPTTETQADTPAPGRPQRTTLTGQHRSTPEDLQTDNVHYHTHTDISSITDYGARGPAPRETPSAGNDRAHRIVQFNSVSFFRVSDIPVCA